MRMFVVFTLVAVGLLTASASHSKTPTGATELSTIIRQMHQVTDCVTNRIHTPQPDLARLCDFLTLFESRDVNALPRDGLRAESAKRLVGILDDYIGKAPSAVEARKRAAAFRDLLSKGQVPNVVGLELVPSQICTDVGVPSEMCSVPDCLLEGKQQEAAARCVATRTRVPANALRAAIAKWRKAHNEAQCPSTDLCLPTDAEAVALRDYLVTNGRQVLGPALEKIAATGDIASLAPVVQENLECWVNRNEALVIASAAQTAFSNLSSETNSDPRLTPLKQTLTEALGTGGAQPIRSLEKGCQQVDVDRIYRATAQFLQTVMTDAVKGRATTVVASLPPVPKRIRCDSDLPKEERFDFAVSESGTVKALRLRRFGDDQGRMQLALVVRDPVPKKGLLPSPCGDSGDLEILLGLAADVAWSGNKPHLGGPFARPAFQLLDPQQLRAAIAQLIPVQGLDLTVDANISTDLVPVTLTITAKIPGIGRIIQLPKVQIDPTKPGYGLNNLVDAGMFRNLLNDELARRFNDPLAIPAFGIEISSLRWLETKADTRAPIFGASARIPAIESITPRTPIDLQLTPSRDSRNYHLELRTGELSQAVTERIGALIREQVNALLAAVPDGLKFGKLDSLQIEVAALTARGIHIESTLHFPGTSVKGIPIRLDIRPDNADLAGQIHDQFSSVAQAVRIALTDYIKHRVLEAVDKLASDTVNKLQASLPPTLPLLETSWSLTDTKLDNEDTRALCFTMVSTQKWAIQKVCTRELDGNGLPRLMWDRAQLNKELVAALAEEVAKLSAPPYFVVKLVSANFEGPTLKGHLSVTVLDFATPIPVVTDLSTTSANIQFNKNAIETAVITAARQQLGPALATQEVSIGGFQLSKLRLPEEGNNLVLAGDFHNGSWVSGDVSIDLYPSFHVHTPHVELGSALKEFIGFGTSPIELKDIDVREDPIVIKVDVKLSSMPLIDSVPYVKLPTLRIDVPLRGSPKIGEPITIPIPVEIPIPPFFSLANPAIAIYPQTMPMKFTGSADFTVVEGTLADIIEVRSSLTVDLKSMRMDFTGPLVLLNALELMRSDGTLDFKETVAEMKSSTSGLVDNIVALDTRSKLDGRQCRFTQSARADIPVLKVEVSGDLALQAKCGQDFGDCPPRGLGAACIKGQVKLGPLGEAEGQLGATLNFKGPVAAANVKTLQVLWFRPSIDVRVANSFARAAFHAGPFDVTVLAPTVDTITPELLEDLLRNALKPHFDLDALKNHQIVLSLLPESKGNEDPESDFDKAEKQAEQAAQKGVGTPPPPGANGGARKAHAPTSATKTPPEKPLPPPITGTPPNGGAPSAGGGASGGNTERVLKPGTVSVVYTDKQRNSAGPLVWRHWHDTVGPDEKDAKWFMHPDVSQALRSNDVVAHDDSFYSSRLAEPDAVPGDAAPLEYIVLFYDRNTDQSIKRCGSGVCTATMSEHNGEIRDVAPEPILRNLMGVDSGPLAPAATANEGALLENSSLELALKDLVIAAWEDTIRVDSLKCLRRDGTECGLYLFRGSRPHGSQKSTIWLQSGRPSFPMFASPESVLEAAGLADSFPPPLTHYLEFPNPERAVLARTDAEFLVHYRDKVEWLALWDRHSLAEILRIAVSGDLSGGTDYSETALEVLPGNFGSALIDAMKHVTDPSRAHIDVRSSVNGPARTMMRSFVLRSHDTTGDSVTYLSSSFDSNHNEPILRLSTYCARSATADVIAARIGQRKRSAEAPSRAPEQPELAVEYLDRFLGRNAQDWRQEGFLVNPAALLTVDPNLPTNACIRQ